MGGSLGEGGVFGGVLGVKEINTGAVQATVFRACLVLTVMMTLKLCRE